VKTTTGLCTASSRLQALAHLVSASPQFRHVMFAPCLLLRRACFRCSNRRPRRVRIGVAGDLLAGLFRCRLADGDSDARASLADHGVCQLLLLHVGVSLSKIGVSSCQPLMRERRLTCPRACRASALRSRNDLKHRDGLLRGFPEVESSSASRPSRHAHRSGAARYVRNHRELSSQGALAQARAQVF